MSQVLGLKNNPKLDAVECVAEKGGSTLPMHTPIARFGKMTEENSTYDP